MTAAAVLGTRSGPSMGWRKKAEKGSDYLDTIREGGKVINVAFAKGS